MIDELLEKGVFKGYVDAVKTRNGVFLSRFTSKQREYGKTSDGIAIRMSCQSGITMDMYTNTRYIEFDFMVCGFTRRYAYFDIRINENPVSSVVFETISSGQTYHFQYVIGESEGRYNHIKVYFPHNVWMVVSNIMLSPGAGIEAVGPRPKNALFLGDSITQGMDSTHPAASYAVKLSDMLRMDMLNQAIGGAIFDADQLDPRLGYKADQIIIAYGSNDWVQSTDIYEFKHRCAKYIETVIAYFPGAGVSVITPIFRFDHREVRSAGTLGELARTIGDVCLKYPKIKLVYGWELVPHDVGLYKDRIHSNDEGHKAYALNLSGFLK